jgi:hypothetical protein
MIGRNANKTIQVVFVMGFFPSGIDFGERRQSAARDLGLSIRTDFIASPLHCIVRPDLSVGS